MKVVAVIDSFKGSMSSLEAGRAAKEGVKRVYPDAQVWVRPLADGGEGTVETLAAGMGGELRRVRVSGPLGEEVECGYAFLPPDTAVIEMAGAAGLPLVPPEKRNPLYTTTYGVGEVILEAVRQGCRRFIVGIGGSATNDGGAGMLQALGFGLLDSEGKQIPRGAAGLKALKRIETGKALPALAECSFQVACDVTNPLCGENGCSAVFGPQKGADEKMVRQMDHWLAGFAGLAAEQFPGADPFLPGAGAAGGMGFAFLAFLNAVLRPGVEIILEQTRLEEYVKQADYVLTGEGRLDGQTAMGKAPVGVAALAGRYHKPVIAFAGAVAEDAFVCHQKGIGAFFPILRRVGSLEEAMNPETAVRSMTESVEEVFRVIKLAEGRKGW